VNVRAAGTVTGEYRRADIHTSHAPEDIHRTQMPAK
jgi:hypothetical protein